MSAEAFWGLRALLSPRLSPAHTEHQVHLRTFSLARLRSFLCPAFSLPFMNDSLSQYCPSDLHGYLAVLVRTTSPQHIFSPQVQTPPGRPRQLQAHLGEIPPGQERLDPLRSSSSRSLRAARQHESEERRRAQQQQRFHRGGGEFSLPRQELSPPRPVEPDPGGPNASLTRRVFSGDVLKLFVRKTL